MMGTNKHLPCLPLHYFCFTSENFLVTPPLESSLELCSLEQFFRTQDLGTRTNPGDLHQHPHSRQVELGSRNRELLAQVHTMNMGRALTNTHSGAQQCRAVSPQHAASSPLSPPPLIHLPNDNS